MTEPIKFTIVTCTYNAEACLQRTLDSVLNQTHRAVEHLIIDGRSTDGTLAMATAYKTTSDDLQCGHTVVVVSEPDRGLYDAMNKGRRRGTGDYVLFLNAGDSFPTDDTLEQIDKLTKEQINKLTKERINKLTDEQNNKLTKEQINELTTGSGEDVNSLICSPVNLLIRSSVNLPAVLYGDTSIVDEEGRVLGQRRLRPPEHLTWRSFRQGMLVCHQAFYVRRDLALLCPYDLQYRYSADIDWCIRVMRQAELQGLPLLNLHRTVACFLDGGMTTQHHRASLAERFRIMRRHYGLATTIAMHAWFVLRNLWK